MTELLSLGAYAGKTFSASRENDVTPESPPLSLVVVAGGYRTPSRSIRVVNEKSHGKVAVRCGEQPKRAGVRAKKHRQPVLGPLSIEGESLPISTLEGPLPLRYQVYNLPSVLE